MATGLFPSKNHAIKVRNQEHLRLKRNFYPISLGSMRREMPSMISLIRAWDKEPIFSMRSDLFTVIICVILTTLSFLRLPSPFPRRTLSEDLALARLEVSAQSTTVLILL